MDDCVCVEGAMMPEGSETECTCLTDYEVDVADTSCKKKPTEENTDGENDDVKPDTDTAYRVVASLLLLALLFIF